MIHCVRSLRCTTAQTDQLVGGRANRQQRRLPPNCSSTRCVRPHASVAPSDQGEADVVASIDTSDRQGPVTSDVPPAATLAPGTEPSARAAGSSTVEEMVTASPLKTSASPASQQPAPSASSTPSAASPAPVTAPPSVRPQKMRLRAALEIGDGPPRMMSLLDPSTPLSPDPGSSRAHLPLMLYLPGIDGSGLAASRQFPSLLRKFDMRTLVTPPSDRTPFAELVAIVADYLRQEVPCHPPTRPIYLLGESFGGLLALAVAAEVPALVDRLVLVNPATSFNSSLWPVIGPLLPQVPAELYRGLPLALAPILANPVNLLWGSMNTSPGASVPEQANALFETATNLLQQLPVLAEILPADTLAWKLELLREGCTVVEPLLPSIQQRCFVMVGDQDLLIPSGEEGPRLQRALPRAQLRVERGRSHALLQEGGVDLAAILEEEGFYTPLRRMSAPIGKRSAAGFGVAAPVELPTAAELDRYAERTTAFGRRLSSPVFISTAADGTRCLGLGNIPDARPLLLVGNHQTLALDLGPLTEQFLRERGVLLRGLAHPVIFSQTFENGSGNASGSGGQPSKSDERSDLPAWDPIPAFGRALEDVLSGSNSSSSSSRTSGSSGATDGRSAFRDFMTTFGAVPVSAFNLHRLLAGGEAVLLFPGGVREAYRRKGEDYQLFWPDKSEFIRMAARFGATIVPFAAVGVDDSLNILADGQQLETMPLVGDMLRRRSGSLPQARKGVSAAVAEQESFVAPLAIPRLPPNRLYFLFQQPIQTSPQDLEDRQRCDELYRQTRQSVEDGLAWLLQQRKRDPYGEFLPRQLYEQLYRGRQAPTFPLA